MRREQAEAFAAGIAVLGLIVVAVVVALTIATLT